MTVFVLHGFQIAYVFARKNISRLAFIQKLFLNKKLIKMSHSAQSFIISTNAHLICFKALKFTLKYTTNAPTCFGLTKPSSGILQSVRR